MLNTQLRPVDGENPSQARGHLQLKLRQVSGGTPDDSYEVAWKGKIFNPAGEAFTSGGIYVPPDPVRPVLMLFEGARDNSRRINLRGRGRLTAAQAEALIATPEDFAAVFATVALPGGTIAGDFGSTAPDDN